MYKVEILNWIHNLVPPKELSGNAQTTTWEDTFVQTHITYILKKELLMVFLNHCLSKMERA